MQIWKRFFLARKYDPRHKVSQVKLPPEEDLEGILKDNDILGKIQDFWQTLSH